jgi:hypothetical protein
MLTHFGGDPLILSEVFGPTSDFPDTTQEMLLELIK